MFGIPDTYSGLSSITIFLTTLTSADTRLAVPFLNIDQHYVFTKHTYITLATTVAHKANEVRGYKAIELHSDEPISASVVLADRDNFEGFQLLPEHVFSTEYIVASYDPYSSSGYYSQFLLFASQPDTTVKFTFPQSYTPSPGQINSLQLQRFETYQYQSLTDLSGTVIKSDKPIGVISGVTRAVVPTAIGSNRRLLIEQLVPTDFYDFNFIVPPLYPLTSYNIRIYVSEDDTQIGIINENDHFVRFKQRYDYFEEAFGDQPTFIQANKPIMVMVYSPNPFMMPAQAISQFRSEYNFGVQATYTENTLVVTIREEYLTGLYVDGSKSAIDAAEKLNVTIDYHVYTILFMSVSQATLHRVHHSNGHRFGAVLYGIESTSIAYGLGLEMILTDTGAYTTASFYFKYT